MVEYLDGNAIGGPLGELFAVDMTAAVGRCASCGTSSAIAEARVYPNCPGLVARCPTCDGVTVRLVRSENSAWLDLTGFTCLELALPADR
jgi:Family of unknown function (DUF6510)